MMIQKKRIGLFAGGLLALAVAAWGVQALMPSEGRWLRVERRDLVLGVAMEGELRAAESVRFGPPAVAQVFDFKISFLAPEGTKVEEGTPVLGFDVTQLRQRLQELIAERDSVEKNLEKSRADLDAEKRTLELQLAEANASRRRARLKLDVPAEITSRRELESARIDHRLAELEINAREQSLAHLEKRREAQLAALERRRERAVREVEEIEEAIENMTIKAPRAGTLTYVADPWSGEKPKIGERVWRGRPVVEIPDLGRMMAEAEVAEADAGRLKVGQRARFRLDAFPDREFGAKLSVIRAAVQTKKRSPQKIVRLELELDETDAERMRPGMRLRGTIEIERQPGTLMVPHEAVLTRAEGPLVEVRTPLGRREVVPTLGERDEEGFAVLDGLDEGDRVLARGASAEVTP